MKRYHQVFYVIFAALLCPAMTMCASAIPELMPMAESVPTPALLEDLPINNSQAILQKTLPAHVDGVIVRPLTNIGAVWHYNDQGDIVNIEPAVSRLLINMNGVEDVYPVDFETFNRVWWQETVKLDCTVLPCVLDKEG